MHQRRAQANETSVLRVKTTRYLVDMSHNIRHIQVPGGWFADVPSVLADEERIGSGDGCTLSVLGTCDPIPEGEDGVLLTGSVLSEDGESTVISCGGLLARVPRVHESARHGSVRIHLHRRDRAA